MSVIIRLQNLPLTASSLDIRNFFHGLSIPDGGVHIVGGPEGDAFIAFSTDEDARQAMRLSGQPLKDSRVSLLLSSRNEMYKVIEQARLAAMGGGPPSSSTGSASSGMHSHSHHHHHLSEDSSPPSAHHHLSSQGPPSSHLNHGYNNHNHHSTGTTGSNTMSPSSSASNDFMKNFGMAGPGQGGPPADLNPNPALLFSTMSSIPSATLGGAAAPASAYLNQQQQHNHSQYPGLTSSSHSQQQNQAAPGGGGQGATSNLPFGVANNPAAAAALANGANPFMHFPPPSNLSGMPFSSMLQGQGLSPSGANANNPLAQAGNLAGMNQTTAAGMGGLMPTGQNMNTTMSMAGQGTSPMNPFGTAPSRMSLMNNGLSNSTGPNNANLPGGPRHSNNFGSGSGMQNQYGAGVGAGMGGPPRHMGPRTPFGTHAATATMPTMNMNSAGASAVGNGAEMKNRFQFGAIPSGRADIRENRDGTNKDVRNNRSDSRERRGVEPPPRRRRSRSRERDRGAERRRRRSKSRSRSRSRSRDRSGAKRRDSRDKRDPERKSRSDSSPEKSSQDSQGRSRREPSPSPTGANTTNEEWPGAKLIGVPNDASYREIKEFIRAEVMGGSDGVVRLYDDGIAYLKLMSPQEFPRVFKSNGRKLRGSVVSIEGITMETWTQEYKLNKSRIERDIDREKEEREKEHDKDSRRERGDRDHRHHTSHSSSSHHRSSRFSNASHESNCIAIRGLAPTITRHELATRYLQDTPCEDIVLIAAPTPTNRHSVTAFIQFASAQTAQTIIDLIARSPLGTSLVVESCDPDDLQRAKARTTPAALGGGGNGNFGNARGGGLSQDTKSIFELDVSLDDETTTVIMKGAPPNISERDVFDFFSDIGLAPMNVKIFHDADGQCSGNVICEFADNNKAKRATTKDGMLFGRGQISVSLLPSRNKRNISGPVNPSTMSGNDFGQQQLNPFGMATAAPVRNQPQRPGLLGTGPTRGSGDSPMSRFNNPTSSPNIFEQALQQQIVPGGAARGGGGIGGRGRGSSGERPSRFNSVNDSRSDYRNQNGFRGRGRGGGRGGGGGGGHHLKGKYDDFSTGGSEEPDLGIFNKKGCVIGLENIPYKASMDDILQYLEDVLKIRIAPNMIIRRFDDNQKATGDARVAFNTEFEAKLACDRLKGTYMWKRLITATVIE